MRVLAPLKRECDESAETTNHREAESEDCECEHCDDPYSGLRTWLAAYDTEAKPTRMMKSMYNINWVASRCQGLRISPKQKAPSRSNNTPFVSVNSSLLASSAGITTLKP